MKVKSIRSKVLIAIIGITLLTATAMAFVFYGRSAKMIEENYVTVLSQRVRLLTDTIDDMLKEVCNIDIKASCDSELKEMLRQYLEDQDESRLSDIANRLRTFSKMNPSIASVYLVIPEKNQVVTTMDYPVYRSDIDAGKIRRFETKIQENDGPVIMDDLVHEESKLLAFAEVVKDTDGTILGYVCTNIGEQNLRYDYMEDPANQELDQIKLIGDGKVIATREVSRIGRSFSEKKYKKWIRHSETAGADEKNIYIYCEGSFSRCGIFAGVKKRAVLSDLMQMRKYIFGIAAGFGIIALMAAVYISRIVYKPVQKLMTAMKAVSDGEMDTRAEIVSKDEIGLAAEEFNRMLDRIEDLIRQLIQEEKKKKMQSWKPCSIRSRRILCIIH